MPHRYRLIVDMAPTGVLLVDLGGRIVLANAIAEEIFGYSHRELIGVNIDQLIPAEFRAEHARLRGGFADQASHRAMAGRAKESAAFQASCDLVFKGTKQPSGYTEPLLHAWRLKVKAGA